MGMTPAQVAKKLGPSEFTKLCSKVDDLSKKPGIRFDIYTIMRNDGKITAAVVTENKQHYTVEV